MATSTSSPLTIVPEMATTLTSQPRLELPSVVMDLQSVQQQELLDVVDSLRANGLGGIIGLPQLIVCGDQSSGKSSVLEAISGMPFPKRDNVCTRFAIEVILRRETRESLRPSIVAPGDWTDDRLEKASEFGGAECTDFEDLFRRAEEIIIENGQAFSKAILRVEISGPDKPQLTLVDVPGLFHSALGSQANTDVDLVSDLVDDYMRNENSIILAIVSAGYDCNNQVILQRVRKFDRNGTRTLGIVTKPDLLARNSERERYYIDVTRNATIPFHLGWHVLKNIDTDRPQSSPGDRGDRGDRDDQEEAFFRESAFINLPPNTRGIASLRTRLSRILFHHIRTKLPQLLTIIRSQTITVEATRDRIGPGRTTVQEQKNFLIDLSDKFQQICRSAVRGDYDHPFLRDDPNGEKRLCAYVMEKHALFAEDIRKKGAKWKVVPEMNPERPRDPRVRTLKEAILEVRNVLRANRGCELPGLPNPLVVGDIFREYSRPWAGIALRHVQIIWDATIKFLEVLLLHLTEPEVHDKICQLWLNPKMEEKLNLAKDKLKELLDVHNEHPFTNNKKFADNRRGRQTERSRRIVEQQLNGRVNNTLTGEDVSSILTAIGTRNDDIDMVAAEDAYDNMNAYYNVAEKLFIDNVPTLAIHATILRNLHELFSPGVVNRMDDEIVSQMASETEDKIRERRKVLDDLDILERSSRTLEQYAIRPGSVLARPPDSGPPDSGTPDSPQSEASFTPASTRAVRGSSATGLAPVSTPNNLLTLRSTSPLESSTPVIPSSSRTRRNNGHTRATSSAANSIFSQIPPVIPPANFQLFGSRPSPGEETTGPTSSVPPASNIFANWTQGSDLHSLLNRGSGGPETGDA